MTTGDSISVTNFQQRRRIGAVDRGIAHRLVGGQHDHGRLRQRHHRWRRRRRRHRGRRRQRSCHLSRHGILDRRRRRQRYAGAGGVRRHHRGQFLGRGRLGPDHRRQRRRHQFRASRRLGVELGADRYRLVLRQHHHDRLRQRHHRRRRRRRRDQRRRRQRHRHLSRHRNLDRRRQRHRHAGDERRPRPSISAMPTRPPAIRPTVTNFQNVDASGAVVGGLDHRLVVGQHHHRRLRQRHHRWRRRRRRHQRRRRQ